MMAVQPAALDTVALHDAIAQLSSRCVLCLVVEIVTIVGWRGLRDAEQAFRRQPPLATVSTVH